MKTSLSRYALGTAVAIVLAAPAYAADDDGAIIVTARRSEERLQDVPISITVMNQEELSQNNITSTADLGYQVPSLAVNNQFGPEKSSFVIRGFTQSYHTAPTVGVYFADVVAPRSVGPTTSGNGAGVGSMFDLENLQVLKGPQGTLFGRNTTGGAILLVPHKPTDKLEGYVEGTYGKYNQRRLQAVLNVPLSDTFKVRAGADWNKRDGYLKNHSGVGPDRYRDVNYIAARLSVLAELTPDLENYTVASYSRSNTNGDVPKNLYCNRFVADNFQAIADGLLAANQAYYIPLTAMSVGACDQLDRQAARGDGFWDVESNLANPLEKITQWQVINTTTWNASDNLTVKNIASYSEYREKASFNLWGDNFFVPAGTYLAGVLLPPAGSFLSNGINLLPGVKGPTTAQSTFTEEFQLQGDTSDGRLNWQAGLYLEVSRPLAFNSQLVDIFDNCSNIYDNICANTSFIGHISDDSTKDWFNDKGIYAQATYKITDQFSVTGGIRYTMDKQKDLAERLNTYPMGYPYYGLSSCQPYVDDAGNLIVGAPTPGLDPTSCDVVRRIKSKKPTWTMNLEYRPMTDVMTYIKWSRGYRMGAITSNSVGFETVGPEKVDTYEAGARTSWHGSIPGFFNITGFYNNFRDQQLTVNTVVAPAYAALIQPAAPNVNAGKSRMWGIEADASIRPFEGFKFDVSYAYLNTKLLKFTQPAPVPFYSEVLPATTVGGPLPLSPKNRVNVSADYTLPLDDSIGKVSFGVTFVHTDKNQSTTPAASPAYLVKASNLLNLNATWASMFGQPIDLSFYMTNATNEKILLFASQAFHTIGIDGGHVNEPRMFGFRLKYRFGEQ